MKVKVGWGKMVDRDQIGGDFVRDGERGMREEGGLGVVSPRRSAFGHQITLAAPITGLRPDIKSASSSLEVSLPTPTHRTTNS